MASPISRKLKSENLKNYEKVRSLAADGMTVAQISAVLGISSRTFYIHLKKDKKLLKAYEEGQQAGVGEVVHALKDLIRKGNLGAIIFWLKNKDPDNWKTVEMRRYVDALLRHAIEFVDNPDSVDSESGIPHYKHMACNMAFICEMMGGGVPQQCKTVEEILAREG